MYRNKEHGRSNAGTLRPAPLFSFASFRLRAFVFPSSPICGLGISGMKKSPPTTQPGPKTFGHLNISRKTPRHSNDFGAALQNPAPFKHFSRKFFISRRNKAGNGSIFNH